MKRLAVSGMIPQDTVRASGSAAKGFKEKLESIAKENSSELKLFEVLDGGKVMLEFNNDKMVDTVKALLNDECPDVVTEIVSDLRAIRERVIALDAHAKKETGN